MRRNGCLASAAVLLVGLGCANQIPVDEQLTTSPVPSGDGSPDTSPETPGTVPTSGEPGTGSGPQTCSAEALGPRQLRRLTGLEFQSTLLSVFPEASRALSAPALGADPVNDLGFSNDAAELVVAHQTASELLEAAEAVASALTTPETLSAVLPCSVSAPDERCALELIESYGERLFRRPLSESETGEYANLFDEASVQSDFAGACKWTLVALIQSPHTVYRSELGTEDSDGLFALTEYEIATDLAYTFSEAPPSRALIEQASRGELDSPEALIRVARELLEASGGRALHSFLREWSNYEKVLGVVRPGVGEFSGVAASMVEETRRFFEHVLIEEAGTVSDLLLAESTFVDSTLAGFYGYGAASDTAFAATTRPAHYGVGLLGQGSLLAGNAQADGSSPTQRGLFVFEKLLCNEPPPVPANIPNVEPAAPGATTTRERFETAHAGNAACQGCHRYFDPIGFAFEHFDEVGRYRADESGLPIDATGHVELRDDGSILYEFDGLTELSTTLADSDRVRACVAELAAARAFAVRDPSCLGFRARTGLATNEYGLLEFFARLAGAPHFTRRRHTSDQ